MTPLHALVTTGLACTLLAGAAFAETKSFDVSGFSEVTATSGVDVAVEVGGSYSVTLETNGAIDEALVEVRGARLVLGRESPGGLRINLGRGARFAYTVTMPDISAAKSMAGADLAITGISGDSVALDASSGSDLEAEGSCTSLSADASSGADIRAFGLACANVRADVSSGADIEVTATGSLRADASSGGTIRVRGNPGDRNIDKSSGGSVRFYD